MINNSCRQCKKEELTDIGTKTISKYHKYIVEQIEMQIEGKGKVDGNRETEEAGEGKRKRVAEKGIEGVVHNVIL